MQHNAHYMVSLHSAMSAVMSAGYHAPSALFYMKNDTYLIILDQTDQQVDF